jgi:alpha-amylase
MASICFYFQVHHPLRLRHYTIFDSHHHYFDDFKNAQSCRTVAEKCYMPSNLLFLDLIRKYQGRFKMSYSLTGILLEQLQLCEPEVLKSFQELADTGCVEFLAETYHHSLSYLYSHGEFIRQVQAHTRIIQKLFGQTPRVFRNTELIYNNDLAGLVEQMGCFDGIVTEGADMILGGRSPNYVYRPVNSGHPKLLLKNHRLSDDIALRFSNRKWDQWPLTAEKYAGWINALNGCGEVVNLFMDYETLGQRHGESTGIFEFMRQLPEAFLRHPGNQFKTPGEVIRFSEAVDLINVPSAISWTGRGKDISAWQSNPMQENALAELYKLGEKVMRTYDTAIIDDWRKLQTSDHFYYMRTELAGNDVHKYVTPCDSPYDSYINFMNILDNLNSRCDESLLRRRQRISSRLCKKMPVNQANNEYSEPLFV